MPSMTSRIVLETKYGKIIRATPHASGTIILCRLPYTKKPRPIEPNSKPQRRKEVSTRGLTVKLMGRALAPGWARHKLTATDSQPSAWAIS
jgi:hypothetical protein